MYKYIYRLHSPVVYFSLCRQKSQKWNVLLLQTASIICGHTLQSYYTILPPPVPSPIKESLLKQKRLWGALRVSGNT